MYFYLGTHVPSWLSKTEVPLFVSRRQLFRRKNFSRAIGPWVMDSGGFSELSLFGRWTISKEQYLDEITFANESIGNIDWCAPQDWMCEPWLLSNTGLSIKLHQKLTVESVIFLRSKTPYSIIPILQGWNIEDYKYHIEMYSSVGIDLEKENLVGLGSICRRQATKEIGEIVNRFSYLNLHGFGVKKQGINLYGNMLKSADSMAWSFEARRLQRSLPQCTGLHKNCANCLSYALAWRDKILAGVTHVG